MGENAVRPGHGDGGGYGEGEGRSDATYGGIILCPWKTSFDSSPATFA